MPLDQNLKLDPGLHAPNWIFWSHFRPNSTIFYHFCKVDFQDHPRFRSSHSSLNVGSSRAPMHTYGCALKSQYGRAQFQPEILSMRWTSSKNIFLRWSEGHFWVGQTEGRFSYCYKWSELLQDWIFGSFVFSEFTHFSIHRVLMDSHAHQWMRLDKLVWKNTVSARDLEYETKIFKKPCSDSVRRPFSGSAQCLSLIHISEPTRPY